MLGHIDVVNARREDWVRDPFAFIEQDGEIIFRNASATAIVRAQKAFAGAAQDFGVANSADVQGLVDEVRYGTGK